MNKFKVWFADNKLLASLIILFVIATGLLGWLTLGAWSDYDTAGNDYREKADKLSKLSQQKIFPNPENRDKLLETIKLEKADLAKLQNDLKKFHVAPYGELDKAKPQDLPQQFQDALRNEVTKVKNLSTTSGSTLPPNFYMGLDEYENRLPTPDEALVLSKQLTVMSWLAETLMSHKGIILAEFAKVQAPVGTKVDQAKKTTSSPALDQQGTPYDTIAGIRVAFRSNQVAFRELVNSISTAPYFLMIESMQLQNSSTEPPRRGMATQTAEGTPSGDGQQNAKLPIVVGREDLNASLKIRALDFPEPTHVPEVKK